MLEISREKVCFIVIRAREVFAKVEVDDPDSGSNPSDDGGADILEDLADDMTEQELHDFIEGLNEDEQNNLVALAWLGRSDDEGLDGWAELLAEAARAHNDKTAEYLLGMPLLADYLEAGLSLHGQSCEEFEMNRL